MHDSDAVDEAERDLDALAPLSPGERTARIATTVVVLAVDFALLLAAIGLVFVAFGLLFETVSLLVALVVGFGTSLVAWLALRRPRHALEARVLRRIADRATTRRAIEDRGATGSISAGGSAVAVPVDRHSPDD